jgi:NADH-quinone oxidoreductase subunit N
MNTLISLAILAILVLSLGMAGKRKWLQPVILIGLLITLAVNLMLWDRGWKSANDMMIFDNYAVGFSSLLIVLTIMVFMMARQFYIKQKHSQDDSYAILLFTLAGGIMMTSFGNLAMLFIGIETLSISLYVLAGSRRSDPRSNEAAMKYFLMGSFASGFLVFGIALVYGASGSFNLDEIAAYINANPGKLPTLFQAGILLITVSLAFKVAAAPFHFWAPDVYDGSPTLITAFMATVVKIAGFAAFYRFFSLHLAGNESGWAMTLAGIAGVTMLLANFTGIYQKRLKRMLAYSSIAHTGYMLLAIISLHGNPSASLLLYSSAYGLATLLGFSVLLLVGCPQGNDAFDRYNGLFKAKPLLGIALLFSMLSLTGIPPLAGFMAKFNLFSDAMESGYTWLVIIALLGSAVSAVYYFRPVIAAFLKSGEQQDVEIPGLFKLPVSYTHLTLPTN